MAKEVWIGLLIIAAVIGIVIHDRRTGGWLYWLSDRTFRRRWTHQQMHRASRAAHDKLERIWEQDARRKQREQEDTDAAHQASHHRGGQV